MQAAAKNTEVPPIGLLTIWSEIREGFGSGTITSIGSIVTRSRRHGIQASHKGREIRCSSVPKLKQGA